MARQDRLGQGRNFVMSVVGSAALLLLMLGVTGCHEGVAWNYYEYAPALAQSQANHELIFVYFRDWASVECTQFEDNVLKQPSARAAIDPLNAVVLQWSTLVDAPLVQRWQITNAPAYVIAEPDETILVKRTHPITLEQLLQDIGQAQATYRHQQAPPSAAPPANP